MNDFPEQFHNPKHSKGSVLMIFAIGLTVLIAFGALSIEVGNILAVQNELQNAADAAALAGAEYLYPASSSGVPGWSSASSYASKEVAMNLANGVKLTAGTVQTGYWDLTGAVKGIQSTIGSILNPTPAVQVTVSLSAGNNGGPFSLIFGNFLGMKTINLSATAVAVVGGPSQVSNATTFPLAISQSTYETYFNKSTGTPKINSQTGSAYTLQLSPNYGTCQFCSFDTQTSNVNTIISMMTQKNPNPLNVSQTVYTQTPLWGGLFGGNAQCCSSCPQNVDVMIPVVNSNGSQSSCPIVGFGCVHIDYGTSNLFGQCYVQCHCINNFKTPNASTGGPNYGVYAPPKLVN